MLFEDRRDAGRKLAEQVKKECISPIDVVLGLPRGGVPVAYEVATLLDKPLDIFVVRKLGAPGREELAVGAIGPSKEPIFNGQLIEEFGLSEDELNEIVMDECRELERRSLMYRKGRAPLCLEDLHVLLVDDGLATGSTMTVACLSARQMNPRTMTVAVPLAPAQTCASLATIADQVICLKKPEPFYSVGQWYGDFAQTDDDEVLAFLESADERGGTPTTASDSNLYEH